MQSRTGLLLGGGWILLALAGGASALSCAKSESPASGANGGEGTSVSNAAMTPEQKVERGKYLVTVGGCNDCHTPGTLYGDPDETRLLSGSELGWSGPWGTTYPRNLTPDKETGIGTWTEDDIVKALKTGQRPDGSPILPPMPWPDYAQMADEDLYAVAAYIQSLPSVSHTVPDRGKPGEAPKGGALVFPPPPAWDAPKAVPPPGTEASKGAQ